MGQHEDGRAGGFPHHIAKLCAQGPAVPPAGAEVRHQSPGEHTRLLIYTQGSFVPRTWIHKTCEIMLELTNSGGFHVKDSSSFRSYFITATYDGLALHTVFTFDNSV